MGGEVGWVFTWRRSLALLTPDKAYLLAESRFPLPSEDRLQYPEPGSRVLQLEESMRQDGSELWLFLFWALNSCCHHGQSWMEMA